MSQLESRPDVNPELYQYAAEYIGGQYASFIHNNSSKKNNYICIGT